MEKMECPHVQSIVPYSDSDLKWFQKEGRCSDHYNCDFHGKNTYLCLARDCRCVLCSGENTKDHSQLHYLENKSHCVQMNLANRRLWCSACSTEVYFLADNDSGVLDDRAYLEEISKPKGLQNIGNTCYMNAALQALCNIPAIREHFTQSFIPMPAEDKKHCLSRNFQRLIEDMCLAEGPAYLTPNGILYGIRNMHPMFRGYHQHDTQEFLRCFMDQLHDELKEQVTWVPRPITSLQLDEEDDMPDEDQSETSTSSGNQSDNDYETADSGVDEWDRKSLSRKHSLSSSPIPRAKLQSRASFRGPNSPNKSKRKPPKYRSIISDVFDGKLLSSVECLTCNKLSTRVETFQDISLPIPSRDHVTIIHQGLQQGTLSPQGLAACSDYKGHPSWVSWLWEWVKSWFWGPTVSLHDCLAAFFSADELKGDNMYSCEKCSKLRNGVKFSKVLKLPEVLCIHLKRFRHELAFSSKINNFVSFPLTDLDMRPYLNKDCKSEVTCYDLSSVICHHGTAGGGHYTCYAVNHFTGQWYELDDQRVTPVSSEVVANCEGYVLFYRKKNERMKMVRDEVRLSGELMSSCPEQTLLEFYVSRRWFNRLHTFAEPGPIDNSDFLCRHGGVDPAKFHLVDKLTFTLNRDLWDYLYQEFRGGPACNNLFQCPKCEEERLRLKNRINFERAQFLALKEDNKSDENQSVIYGMSMAWYRQWEAFVQGQADPPGLIDNSPILTTVNGQKVLKPNVDYVQFPQEVWHFFWSNYGGGPELILRTPTRGPSRASFSSGISVERERDRISVSASKAKSVESLPANIGTGDGGCGVMTQEPRTGRTHSVSSDNVNIKIAASAAAHRKQQSLDNMRLERAIKIEPDCSKENQRKVDLCESKENEYCPAFTPDELDSYVPFETAQSRL